MINYTQHLIITLLLTIVFPSPSGTVSIENNHVIQFFGFSKKFELESDDHQEGILVACLNLPIDTKNLPTWKDKELGASKDVLYILLCTDDIESLGYIDPLKSSTYPNEEQMKSLISKAKHIACVKDIRFIMETRIGIASIDVGADMTGKVFSPLGNFQLKGRNLDNFFVRFRLHELSGRVYNGIYLIFDDFELKGFDIKSGSEYTAVEWMKQNRFSIEKLENRSVLIDKVFEKIHQRVNNSQELSK